MSDSPKDIDPQLRARYPEQDDEWLQQAQENLYRYLGLALRIYERIREDPTAYASFRELLEKQKGTKRKGGDLAESGK